MTAAAGTASPVLAAPGAPVVGMVGAGQLARMSAQAAVPLGIGFRVLAGAAGESAAQVCAGTVLGDYASAAVLLDFAAGCDVVTFDHEHVPQQALRELERAGVAIRPAAAPLRYAQDKRRMRERLTQLGVPCPPWAPAPGPAEVAAFAGRHHWPVVLKAVTGGYDGKGVWFCAGPDDAARVLALGPDLIVEEHVPIVAELAAVVARSYSGQGAAYPVVQTVQADGICREVIAPAPGLPPDEAAAAQRLALRIAADLGVTGILAVELFRTERGLIVNELAMRPHNSAHWSIEGAVTSQFEQHLRAVLNLPLGAPELAVPHAVMVNVLGGGEPGLHDRLLHVMAGDPGVKVHLYGKQARPGRKIGHVTVTGCDLPRLRDRAAWAARYLSLGTERPAGRP
jgi:5-(carboxyamino)imidazole ribonucleotide synthase